MGKRPADFWTTRLKVKGREEGRARGHRALVFLLPQMTILSTGCTTADSSNNICLEEHQDPSILTVCLKQMQPQHAGYSSSPFWNSQPVARCCQSVPDVIQNIGISVGG